MSVYSLTNGSRVQCGTRCCSSVKVPQIEHINLFIISGADCDRALLARAQQVGKITGAVFMPYEFEEALIPGATIQFASGNSTSEVITDGERDFGPCWDVQSNSRAAGILCRAASRVYG
jgi:hypothetical protein